MTELFYVLPQEPRTTGPYGDIPETWVGCQVKRLHDVTAHPRTTWTCSATDLPGNPQLSRSTREFHPRDLAIDRQGVSRPDFDEKAALPSEGVSSSPENEIVAAVREEFSRSVDLVLTLLVDDIGRACQEAVTRSVIVLNDSRRSDRLLKEAVRLVGRVIVSVSKDRPIPLELLVDLVRWGADANDCALKLIIGDESMSTDAGDDA